MPPKKPLAPRFLTIGLASLLTALSWANAHSAPQVLDRVAALVNEEMIPLTEVYSRAAPHMVMLEQQGKSSPQARKDILKRALEDCIADRLLAAEQKTYGISVTEAEIDAAIEDVRTQNHMDAAMFEKALQAQGMTMKSYRNKLRQDLGSMRLVNFKVRSKIKVSDEDIQAEYDRIVRESKADFEVHARHIVIQVPKGADAATEEKARQEAQALADKIRGGEDFVLMAKKYSQSASRDSGGDLGFFKRGDMVPAFETAAFGQEVGEVSAPVRTPFGWHIIKTEEKRPLAVPSLDTLRPKIQEKLARGQMQRQTERYVSELRARAEVDIKVDDLK